MNTLGLGKVRHWLRPSDETIHELLMAVSFIKLLLLPLAWGFGLYIAVFRDRKVLCQRVGTLVMDFTLFVLDTDWRAAMRELFAELGHMLVATIYLLLIRFWCSAWGVMSDAVSAVHWHPVRVTTWKDELLAWRNGLHMLCGKLAPVEKGSV